MSVANGSRVNAFNVALLALALALAILFVLYWSTFQSMLAIWLESATFSHGVLVFPASAFLIWRSREKFTRLPPKLSWLGLSSLALSLMVWMVARMGSIQVGEQFAFVTAVIAVCWAVLGTRIVREMAFPLAFLFFAVPFGEVAIPYLMQFTAWFSVAALELTGIPVYRSGFFLTIPTGDFEIAKACSGIRYVIASFSLGTLFAYLTYHSIRRRLTFMLFSLALPILANGLRAYGIVMLAHLSDMRLAVGVDHLIYGWLFFGLVMFFAFVVGSRFRDKPPAASPPMSDGPSNDGAARWPSVAAAACVAMLIIPPVLMHRAEGVTADSVPPPMLTAGTAEWQGPVYIKPDFVPAYRDYDYISTGSYRAGAQRIDVVIQTYADVDKELINALNFMADRERHMLVESEVVSRSVGNTQWQVVRSVIRGAAGRRIALSWFQIGDKRATGNIEAKFYEAWARFLGEARPRALITMSTLVADTDYDSDPLSAFLLVHGERIAQCVVEPAAADCHRSGAPE